MIRCFLVCQTICMCLFPTWEVVASAATTMQSPRVQHIMDISYGNWILGRILRYFGDILVFARGCHTHPLALPLRPINIITSIYLSWCFYIGHACACYFSLFNKKPNHSCFRARTAKCFPASTATHVDKIAVSPWHGFRAATFCIWFLLFQAAILILDCKFYVALSTIALRANLVDVAIFPC